MDAGQHIVSLSLGNAAEPSAVAVIDPRTEFERRDVRSGGRDWENYFDVIHLERFAAGRPIPTVVDRMSEIMSGERLTKNCHLLLDITSTGAAPIRVFESRGLYPAKEIDLANTGTDKSSGGVQQVPVRDVIGAAQVVLQTNRLKVASALDLASTLVGDLQSFDPKPVARGLDLRGGRNSDLVLALAVALWWGDNLTWGAPELGPHRHVLTGPCGWMGA